MAWPSPPPKKAGPRLLASSGVWAHLAVAKTMASQEGRTLRENLHQQTGQKGWEPMTTLISAFAQCRRGHLNSCPWRNAHAV